MEKQNIFPVFPFLERPLVIDGSGDKGPVPSKAKQSSFLIEKRSEIYSQETGDVKREDDKKRIFCSRPISMRSSQIPRWDSSVFPTRRSSLDSTHADLKPKESAVELKGFARASSKLDEGNRRFAASVSSLEQSVNDVNYNINHIASKNAYLMKVIDSNLKELSLTDAQTSYKRKGVENVNKSYISPQSEEAHPSSKTTFSGMRKEGEKLKAEAKDPRHLAQKSMHNYPGVSRISEGKIVLPPLRNPRSQPKLPDDCASTSSLNSNARKVTTKNIHEMRLTSLSIGAIDESIMEKPRRERNEDEGDGSHWEREEMKGGHVYWYPKKKNPDGKAPPKFEGYNFSEVTKNDLFRDLGEESVLTINPLENLPDDNSDDIAEVIEKASESISRRFPTHY